MKLGALCAQAPPEQVICLEQFGKNLGLAFQISDDLLDLKGEQDKMGKRVGKDHVKGKLTYPAAVGVPASEEMAAKLIQDAVASLARFGSRADPLIELANFVISRTR
jgi:geranylgeranyl diphosphate synthase type II